MAVHSVYEPEIQPRWFRVLAWSVLAFTLVVIVSGDIVQATESGAGCGETWPRCDGSLIPSIGDAKTAIEFTHRMATALLGFGFIALVLGAWYLSTRRSPLDAAGAGRGASSRSRLLPTLWGRPEPTPMWRATAWAAVFFVLEVVIGALLVVFAWVENDASIGRVVADSVHVVNTFLLIGAVALAAYFASGGRAGRLERDDRTHRMLVGGVAVLITIAISGAINSLADTLYFAEGVDVDSTPIASILVSIRGIHPALAIGGGVVIFLLTRYLNGGTSGQTHRLGLAIEAIIWTQFTVGLLNIALLTPLEVQIVHLVLADSLWVVFLLFAVRRIAEGAAEVQMVEGRPAIGSGS